MKQSQAASCPTAALKMLGDFWTLSIIETLHTGEKRFCQIERELENINPVTLTNRLKKLEQEKIIRRLEETVDKLSVTYSLTDKGTAIMPIIRAIAKFSTNHLG